MARPRKVPMTPEEKRALALKYLEETDPDVFEAVNQAQQEKESQGKVDDAMRDEAERQRNEPHFWLELHRVNPEEPDTQFFGCAGVSYLLQRGVRVPVPESLLKVLDNAEVGGFVPIVDEVLGVKYLRPVKFRRFSISMYGPATKEEVEKFRAECDRKRLAAEGQIPSQEMARARLTGQSINNSPEQEPFVPAYLQQ